MPASTSQRRTKPKVRRNSDVIHTGHLFALLDFVLMASSPPPELPYFSARKNDTPTRLLPQDQTRNISNTFVPIARFHRGA